MLTNFNDCSNFKQQFLTFMTETGVSPPPDVIDDGKIHRFSTNGNTDDKAGWYVLYSDGLPAGGFGCWRTGIQSTWKADLGRPYSLAESQALKLRTKEIAKQREATFASDRLEAKKKASSIWSEAPPADEHPYLVKKGVKPYVARESNGSLIIPLFQNDEIVSLQYIDADGNKRFLKGGEVSGSYCTLGEITDQAPICICEGYATGATIHEATKLAVVIAFNSGNLLKVARTIRNLQPQHKIIIAGDDDWANEVNIGKIKATEAAIAVKGILILPTFAKPRLQDQKDFNDMARDQGSFSIAVEFMDLFTQEPIEERANDALNHEWPEPQSLNIRLGHEPYPIEALPVKIRAAVDEVHGFAKAPIAMIASSALSALSLSIQAHADIERAPGLHSPTGLFMITIADSGERKSTIDNFFMSAIRAYEAAQAEAVKPLLKAHNAALSIWEAKYGGVKDKIRQDTKGGKPTAAHESELHELAREKPEPPKFPRLTYSDATPESLAVALAQKWPSAGVVAAEAGIVFGSHGMGKDSVTRNLSQLNQLWDGNSLQVDRKTTDSFMVKDARITMSLMIQEATLRDFYAKSGALARGTGFFARFLLAWPESTQGHRPFTEPPDCWPALSSFNSQISAILDQPAPIDQNGGLQPVMMRFSPDAKKSWKDFYNAIESELKNGGELFDVKDVASKTADNAARLSALLQIFEHGMGGTVCKECFDSASQIAAWHLREALRFFSELALPVELANAARLDAWLIDYCRRSNVREIPKNHVRQSGPLRDKSLLDTAIKELQSLDRIWAEPNGKKVTITLNPSLLVQR